MANTGVSFAPAVLTPEPGRSQLAADTTVITVDLANGTRLKIGAQASPTLVTAALHLAKYVGLFQADAFDGYRKLYLPDRSPGPILEAACWAHARRPFFAMADLEQNARQQAAGKKAIVLSPIAIEVVRRIDALFEIERPINGKRPKNAAWFDRN